MGGEFTLLNHCQDTYEGPSSGGAAQIRSANLHETPPPAARQIEPVIRKISDQVDRHNEGSWVGRYLHHLADSS